MGNDGWRTEAERLRGVLSKGRRRGRGGGYEPGARLRAIAVVRQGRREGASLSSIARALGVHPLTLGGWDKAARDETFAAVVVAEDERRLTLVSPTGWRIEGLRLDELRALVLAVR